MNGTGYECPATSAAERAFLRTLSTRMCSFHRQYVYFGYNGTNQTLAKASGGTNLQAFKTIVSIRPIFSAYGWILVRARSVEKLKYWDFSPK